MSDSTVDDSLRDEVVVTPEMVRPLLIIVKRIMNGGDRSTAGVYRFWSRDYEAEGALISLLRSTHAAEVMVKILEDRIAEGEGVSHNKEDIVF